MKAARARSAASAWNAGRQVPVLCPAGAGCERERAGQPKLEALSTVTASAGGPARSSSEAPVMGAERRGRLIWICSHEQPGRMAWEETREQVRVAGKAVCDTEAARLGGV